MLENSLRERFFGRERGQKKGDRSQKLRKWKASEEWGRDGAKRGGEHASQLRKRHALGKRSYNGFGVGGDGISYKSTFLRSEPNRKTLNNFDMNMLGKMRVGFGRPNRTHFEGG